jgi:hypothetical protein
LDHLLTNPSRSSITQGWGTRFWQLAKNDMPSLAKTSASFKVIRGHGCQKSMQATTSENRRKKNEIMRMICVFQILNLDVN